MTLRTLLLRIPLILCAPLARAQAPDLPQCDSAVRTEGFHLGNGGDVVVHRDAEGRIDSIMLLDFYEARTQRPAIRHDLGPATLSVHDKLELAFRRIERLDRARAMIFRQWRGEFAADACFLAGVTLEDVPDSQHVQLPRGPGWAIEQIAVQRSPVVFPEDKRYIVSLDLWDALDNDAKAGLILHELFYRDAIASGTTHSGGVRYLTSVFASDYADDWTLPTYHDRLRRAGVMTASIGDVWIDLKDMSDPQLWSTGVPKWAPAVHGTGFASPFGWIEITCQVWFDQNARVRGFSFARAMTGLRATVAGREVELMGRYPRRGETRPPCTSDDGRPLLDVWLDDPRAAEPDRGYYAFRILEAIPLATDWFEVQLADLVQLSDGEPYHARNDPTSGPAWVELHGKRCALDPGDVMLSQGVLYAAMVRKCSLQIGRNIVHVSGHTKWSLRAPARTIESATLGSTQPLHVGAHTASFAAGTVVELFPSGELAQGVLAADADLPNAEGSLERFFADSRLTLAEDGRVLTWHRPGQEPD